MEVNLKRLPLYPKTGYSLLMGAFGGSVGIEEEV